MWPQGGGDNITAVAVLGPGSIECRFTSNNRTRAVFAKVQNGRFRRCWRVTTHNTKMKKQAAVKTTKDDAAASAPAGDGPTVTRHQAIPV